MAEKLLSEDTSEVEKALNEILELTGDSTIGPDLCDAVLSALKKHPALGGKVAEVFASLAREDSFRDVAESCKVIPEICPLLASAELETQLHALRATANLCFDHNPNRELVFSSGGCPLLIEALTRCSLLPTEARYERLKHVACGCVLNVANDNNKLCKELVGLQAVEILSRLLSLPGEAERTVEMGLNALSVLLESGSTETDLLSPPTIPPMFIHLLDLCLQEKLDIMETVLDALLRASEASARLRLPLVEAGVVDRLLQMQQIPNQLKAIETLDNLCGEDTCLKQLSSHPSLIPTAQLWLTGPFSHKRCSRTALLISNMARTDEMCSSLISSDVLPLLFQLAQLAETTEPMEPEGHLHYYVLSALRNLCIPSAHKQLLIEKGLIPIALRCLQESKWPHIHFKALGVARLLADKQEAACHQVALSKSGTIFLICKRCFQSKEHHVTIEGARLLAAIVKHGNSKEVMKAVAAEGGVKLIISLLNSGHILLRNEALIALSLFAVLEDVAITDALLEGGIVNALGTVLAAVDSSPEVLSNALTLSQTLAKTSDFLKKELQTCAAFVSSLHALCQRSSASNGASGGMSASGGVCDGASGGVCDGASGGVCEGVGEVCKSASGEVCNSANNGLRESAIALSLTLQLDITSQLPQDIQEK